MKRSLALVWLVLLGMVPVAAAQDDFDRPPIEYSQSPAENPVSALAEKLERGEAQLEYDNDKGYLESLLKALDVPTSSQMLVFSKTSLQRQRIAPRTPRALYFNDDVYIGYCHLGDVIEISVADPKLGTVFYTLDQEESSKPPLTRQTDNCLICHGSSNTGHVPGHVVRSVFADASGQPVLSSGSFRIDHTSPLEQRWGGWYVTGTHGSMKHMGNHVAKTRTPEEEDNSANLNLTDVSDRFYRDGYLTPHSDIVALMVMEHQTMCHNLLTKANFTARQAMHYEESLNRELGKPADHRWDSTTSRIRSTGEPLVKCLLFSGEAKLTAPIAGTSGFAEEFAARGPRDDQGRSLRTFDLQTRLFKYPLSYLIYSKSFDALPEPMKDYVWRRLHEVLSGEDTSEDFAHLSAADRQAILEILRATKEDLPEYLQK